MTRDYTDMLSGLLGCSISMTPHSEYRISIERDIWGRPAVTLWHLFPFVNHGNASLLRCHVPLKGRNTTFEAANDAWHLLSQWWQHGPTEMLIEAYELRQTQDFTKPASIGYEPQQLRLL